MAVCTLVEVSFCVVYSRSLVEHAILKVDAGAAFLRTFFWRHDSWGMGKPLNIFRSDSTFSSSRSILVGCRADSVCTSTTAYVGPVRKQPYFLWPKRNLRKIFLARSKLYTACRAQSTASSPFSWLSRKESQWHRVEKYLTIPIIFRFIIPEARFDSRNVLRASFSAIKNTGRRKVVSSHHKGACPERPKGIFPYSLRCS